MLEELGEECSFEKFGDVQGWSAWRQIENFVKHLLSLLFHLFHGLFPVDFLWRKWRLALNNIDLF